MPSSSGNGIEVWLWTTSLTPAASDSDPKYSNCSTNNFNDRPEVTYILYIICNMVCLCVRERSVYARECVCVCVNIYIYIYIYICVCVWGGVRACVRACVRVCVHEWSVYVRECVCMCLCVRVRARVCVPACMGCRAYHIAGPSVWSSGSCDLRRR